MCHLRSLSVVYLYLFWLKGFVSLNLPTSASYSIGALLFRNAFIHSHCFQLEIHSFMHSLIPDPSRPVDKSPPELLAVHLTIPNCSQAMPHSCILDPWAMRSKERNKACPATCQLSGPKATNKTNKSPLSNITDFRAGWKLRCFCSIPLRCYLGLTCSSFIFVFQYFSLLIYSCKALYLRKANEVQWHTSCGQTPWSCCLCTASSQRPCHSLSAGGWEDLGLQRRHPSPPSCTVFRGSPHVTSVT